MNPRKYPKKYNYIYIDIFLRLLFPILIIFNVWSATIGVFLLDMVDGEIFKRSGCPRKIYCIWDKVLDFYWYIFILIYLIMYNVSNLYIFIILFIFRLTGQIIFSVLRKEAFLFYFPNLFEPLFYCLLICSLYEPAYRLFNQGYIFILLIILIPLILAREYIIHIKKMNFSWLFNGNTTYWNDDKTN